MTADKGYELDWIRTGDDLGRGTEVAGAADMDVGDTKTVPLATGKTGTLKRVDKDTYTFSFPNNNNDHCIHVAWKPIRAEVKAVKKWYDKNNEFQSRRDVIFHVNGSVAKTGGGSSSFPKDFLPSQKLTVSGVADGQDAGTAVWGDQAGYTSAGGQWVYKDISTIPVQQVGDPAQDLYYFYDHATHKFVGYTYNSLNGKYTVYDGNGDDKPDYAYYVDFLPKYDETGERIEYTVEEDEVPGYSLHTITKNDGKPYTGNDVAQFDYVLSNTLDPVGVVRVKATKSLKGRALTSTDDFIFVLAGEDEAPMPVKTAVKIPAQGEDTPDKVVAHARGSGKVTADADFGVIAYRKSDLDAEKVTYRDATKEQKKVIRFWTLTWTDQATQEDITRTFDLKDSEDKADFETNLPAAGISTDDAEGTFYNRIFTYTVTENPNHPDYVENDNTTQNMKVRVLYDELQNKIYIDDEDTENDNNGVRDITAETRAKLSDPDVTLHKDFFTNTYDNETDWDPEVVKTLKGRPMAKDQFKDYFTIKAVDTSESVSKQVSDVLAAADTPMPVNDQGKPTYGGTADSKTQEIQGTSQAPKGTNDVKAIVGFNTIVYTNDDMKKEVFFGGSHDDEVIHWEKGSTVYGPIPAEAEASVTKDDGTKETVRYTDATDAQREEAAQAGWAYEGKTYIDDSLMTAEQRAAALNGAKGTFYLTQRDFTYKIWESGPAKQGYKNDPSHSSEGTAYTVVVTVTRNADGTLFAATPKVNNTQITQTDNPLQFENTYEAKGLVNLKASKVLKGRDLKKDDFTFTVTPKNGAPAPASSSATNAANGTIDFGNITFTQEDFKSVPDADPGAYDAVRTVNGFYEKDFVYVITETPKNTEGLTSDTKTITCVITVREDDKGNITVVAVNGNTAPDADLKTSFSVDRPEASGADPAKSTVNAGQFTNQYAASGTVNVPGKKILNGGKLRAGDFYFQLLDSQGNVIGTTSNDADGKFSFTQAYNLDQVRTDKTAGICTSADATDPDNGPWTYTYNMKELKADNRGGEEVTYDATGTGAGYTVTVTVTDDGKGNLTAKAKYKNADMSDSNRVEFTNTLATRDLTLQKIWIDKDADEISKVTRPSSVVLTITADTNDTSLLKPADGWTVSGNNSVRNVTLTKADDATSNEVLWRKTIENLPRYKADGTTAIKYTVDELAANVPANYVKSVVAEANTVINTYDITSITGTKKWVDGEKPHKISADLDKKLTVKWTDEGGATGTVSDPHIDYDNAASKYTVIGLPKFSDDGKLRTYYVVETQLDGYKAPVYTNTGSAAGKTDGAYNGGTITNTITGTIDVTGTKVWKGGTGSTTPTLTLHRQSTKAGSAEDTDFVSPAPTWTDQTTKYIFANQDRYDTEGYEYEYWVTETPVAGYLPPEYSDGDRANNKGTITNVKEPEGTFDVPVTKILTGSTRLSEWEDQFKLSLFTGTNGTGEKIGSTKTVGAGTLSADGLSDSADVAFTGIPVRIYRDQNDGNKVKAAINAGSTGSPNWVLLTDKGNGTFETTLYVFEELITAAGLTQPADGGTPVKVTVINNNDGTLTVNTDAASYAVNNKHEQEVTANIAVKKILNGRDLKATDAFTFTAEYVPDDTLSDPEKARISKGIKDNKKSDSTSIANMTRSGNTATGTIPFTFTKTGTYKFKVTESGKVAGVTNDTKAGEEITVTVTKKNDGTLNAAIAYADGNEADFTNKYEAEGDARPQVRKFITGTSWEADMSFWFKLTPKTAPAGYTTATMPKPELELEGAHVDRDNKTASWDLSGFTLDSAGKEFVYAVQEQEPSFTGYVASEWQNDRSEHTITIVPYDKGDGTLGFRYYYDGATTETGAPLIITNRKKGTGVNIMGSKEVVDEDGNPYWPDALGSFELNLTRVTADAPMPSGVTGDTKSVTVSDTSQVNFGLIDFDAKYNALPDGQSKTFNYKITETVDSAKTYIDWGIENTNEYTIEVTIAKDAQGHNEQPVITCKDAAGQTITGYAVVKNEYKPEGEVTLKLTKDLQGRALAENEFSFTLYDRNGNVAKDENGANITGKLNNASGKVTLGTLKFAAADVANSPITYNIREDIPVGAKAADDETLTYAADTTLQVRDAHVWVKNGVTYDPAITHPLTIELEDNGDGTLTVTPSTATDAPKDLTVTNIYEAEGTQTFKVYKYLDERPIKRAGFTFELKSIGGAPMPEGVTGDTTTTQVLPSAEYRHDGTASFADIVYTMDDLLVDPEAPSQGYETKTFEYEIKEVTPAQSHDGLTYADTIYEAEVTVADNGDGTLSVTPVITKKSGTDPAHHNPDTSAGTADFTNVYDSDGSAQFSLVKTLLGRAWQDGDSFTLNIEAADGSYTYQGPEQGKKDIPNDDVPLPGNTIDPDHRDQPGNPDSSTVVIKKTDDPLGAQSRIKTSAKANYTDEMLGYDPADGILKGTYFYKVTEDTTGLAAKGFTQTTGSTTTYYVRVDVTDDRLGNLETAVSYYTSLNDAKNGTNPFTSAPLFSNTYDASRENIPVAVTKFLDATAGQDDGWAFLQDSDSFTFKAKPVGAGPAMSSGTVTIAKSTPGHTGNLTIAKIELSSLTQITTSAGQLKYSNNTPVPADVNYGQFVGQVWEEDPDVKGVDKDESVIYVKLTAIDDLQGGIDVQFKYYSDVSCTQEITFDRSAADDIEFVNTYRDTMDVVAEKVWLDGDKDDDDRPDVTLSLSRKVAGGAEETLQTLDGNGKVFAKDGTTELTYADGKVTAAADQLPVTFKNVPSKNKLSHVYTYDVTETEPDGYVLTKKTRTDETDPATGDPTKTTVTLTNTLRTKINVEKVWKDEDDSSNRGEVIVAALKRDGSYTDNITLVRRADSWKASFDDLPMYNETGGLYTYTAKEMAVPEEYYTSLVEYSLDESTWTTTLPEGWNTAEEKYVRITNILLRDLEVEKVWDGIPVEDVTYELYRSTNPSAASAITEDPDTHLKNWTPDDSWTKVKDRKGNAITHTFPTSQFDPVTGGSKKYTFTDLERYDKNGNEYTYRVKETTTGQYFKTSQTSDVKVINSNDYKGSGKANPNVVKELDGRQWNSQDKFFFRIEPVKKITGSGDDLEVEEFTNSQEDVTAKAHVPMPTEPIAEVTKSDTQVGAIGRNVAFGDITFLSGNGDDAHVKEGGTAEYYYKIYEVDGNGDPVGDDRVEGIKFDQSVHYLTIEVSDDGNGKVETNRFWDGNKSSSAVPVYTNEYEASGKILGYVIKRIAGREFKDGDKFTFEVTNLAGAPLRFDEDAPAVTEATPTPLSPVGYSDGEGVYVAGTGGKYTATGAASGQDKATTMGVQYMKSEDLKIGSDGIARGTFLYSFREWKGKDSDDPADKVEDLDYDENVLYMKLDAVDDQKGNINLTYKYYLDAACTKSLQGREAAEPSLLVVTESDDEDVLAVGDIAPAGAAAGPHVVTEAEAQDQSSPYYGMTAGQKVTYGFIESAYFRNTLTKDIPVTKEWVDEKGNSTPATDNVTVELYRYPVFIGDDGMPYSDKDKTVPAVLPTTYGESKTDWQFVRSDTFEMGSFTEDNDYKFTLNFDNVDLYEQNADGVPTTRQYIFRVKEITGSQAYETTYATETGGTAGEFAELDTTTKDKNTLSNEDGLAVRNKITATNIANIAAAKQLLGREWRSDGGLDRYHFTLTPLGKGTYDATGSLIISGGKPVYDQETGTDIPMPGEIYSEEATGKNDAVAADYTQLHSGGRVQEKVGEGERLARFGEITYTQKGLESNPTTGRMQGDFFYELSEVIPAGAKNAAGQTYGTPGAEGPWTYQGVTYDGKTCPIHVKVRENRTGELVVQVAYDEKTVGDINTGSQFTPVFTNRYDASAEAAAKVDKYIMGRNWKQTDVFDFALSDVGGAPLTAADAGQISKDPADIGSKTVENREGAFVKRMTVTDDEKDTSEKLTMTYPAIVFKHSDLNKTNSGGSGLKYRTGGDVPAGVAYGEFIYEVEETDFEKDAYPKDLNLDDNTEYIKYTVIDKGDGTLDVSWKIYEDRNCQTEHRDPKDSSKIVENATFINQALRDITVVKTWRGRPPADANVTLQYGLPSEGSDEGYEWTDYDTWTFQDDTTPDSTQPDDTINGLTVKVQVYEHTFSGVPVYYDSGANPSFSDTQLKWRVVETSITGVETYFGVEPSTKYADADKSNKEADVADDRTITEKRDFPIIGKLGFDPSTANLDDTLNVTNVYAPQIDPARANVSAVKDIKGREWNNREEYEFQLTPVGIGTYDEDGSLYVLESGKVDRDKLKKEGGTVITVIPMPSENAKAKVDNDHPEYHLSDSQWQAYFGPISIPVDKLEMVKKASYDKVTPKADDNPQKEGWYVSDGQGGYELTEDTEVKDKTYYKKTWKEALTGDFFYDMTEVIPSSAVAVNKETGEEIDPALTYGNASDVQKAQYNWKAGDMLYDTSSNEVRVHVERVGDELVVTVSYDGRDVGGAVPVFTNRYAPATVDLPVTKTWVDEDGNTTDPIDNVTVNLQRYAVYVNPENGKYYDNPDYSGDPINLPDDIDDWEPVDTHTFLIGDFYYTQEEADAGTIPAGKDVGDLKDKVTYIFTDLPTDEQNKKGEVTGKKYIYRIREASGSSAYESTYTKGDSTDKIESWTGTDTTGEKIGVVNEIKATDTAYIAAVKQLVGRDWKNSDAFTFKLTAVKGKLGDGTDVPAADVPMPADAATAQDGKATAVTDSQAVVGENERLARFGGITFDLKDLAYNETNKRMEGDFYYTMKEVVPETGDGYMTYDTREHKVHVQVYENRSSKLEVDVAYDETTEGDISTGTRFTPVFVNHYEEVNLTARKVWVGDQGVDGVREKATDFEQKVRPEEVTFVLTAKKPNGDPANVFKNGSVDVAGGDTNVLKKTADSEDEWKYIFETLPSRTKDGLQITYTLDEDMDVSYRPEGATEDTTIGDNYEKEILNLRNTSIIVNTFKAASSKTDVYAKKIWAGDEDNKDGRKLVKFQLYQTVDDATKAVGDPVNATADSPTYEPIVDEETGNCVVWKDKPTKIEGLDVTYTVKEVDVPPGYSASTEGSGTEEDPYVITNTLDPTTVDVPVMKKWEDSGDQEGLRPDKVTVRLLANGSRAKDQDGENVPDLELNDGNNWKRVFKGVPATDKKGKAIAYTVVEMDGEREVGSGGKAFDGKYTVTITGDQSSGYVITNSYQPGTITVTATKVWDGDEEVKNDTRREVTLHLIGRTEKDKTAAIAFDGGAKTIAVNKAAAEGDPAGDPATWTKLPKKIGGKTLIWEVYEDVVPGYVMSGGNEPTVDEETGNAAFTITNTYAGATGTVTATKFWVDDADRDGLRDDIYLQLWRKVGDEKAETVGDPVKIDVDRNAPDGEPAGTAAWEDLPEVLAEKKTEKQEQTVYNPVDPAPEVGDAVEDDWYVSDGEGGYKKPEETQAKEGVEYFVQTTEEIDVEVDGADRAVIYWVKEVDAQGREKAPEGYTCVVTQTEPGIFAVTNIHEPEKISLKVKKIWNDKDDADGIRPDHVVIRVKNGDATAAKATITEKDTDDGWISEYHTFSNLPKKENGQNIDYKIVEVSLDGNQELDGVHHNEFSENYTVSITESAERTYDVTNTHAVSGLVSVRATKVWEGDEDDTSERKDVTLRLVKVYEHEQTGARHAVEGSERTVATGSNHDQEMTAEWKDLPTVQDGENVYYTVEEETITGYTPMIGSTEEKYYEADVAQDDDPAEMGLFEKIGDEYVQTKDVRPEDGKVYYIKGFEITVTNTRGEVPYRADVLYIDPLNKAGAAGAGQMIVKSTPYKKAEDAKAAAQGNTDPPGDPSHSGYKFLGWALNWDDNNNYVLVATYSAIPTPAAPIVSYVDGQNSNPLLASDTGSVKKPKNPKHKNLQFIGWKKVTDSAGNVIYVAQYKADCSGGSGSSGGSGKSSSVVDPDGSGSRSARTGDDADLVLWIILILTSIMIMAALYRMRRRDNHL